MNVSLPPLCAAYGDTPGALAAKWLGALRPKQRGPASLPRWVQQVSGVADEYPKPVSAPILGSWPQEARGTFFRNGPGAFFRNGHSIENLLDAPGMIHGITIGAQGASYRSKLVMTKDQRAEDRAQTRLFATLGHNGPHPCGVLFHGGRPKNVANTSVANVGGKIVALYEAGEPYQIDPATLATLGPARWPGDFAPGSVMSGHPKTHPSDGSTYNFSVHYSGMHNSLTLYRFAADQPSKKVATIRMPFVGMAHDFLLSENKAVFFMCPIVMTGLDILRWQSGHITADGAFSWKPQRGTHIAIVDLHTGKVTYRRTSTWPILHTLAMQETPQGLVAQVCMSENAAFMSTMRSVAMHRLPPQTRTFLTEIILPEQGCVRLHRLSETPIEFPATTAAAQQRPKTVFGLTWRANEPLPSLPVRIDVASGRATPFLLRDQEFCGEPALIKKRHARTEADAWLMCLVDAHDHNTGELRIYDGARVGRGVVARVRLPQRSRFGFHTLFYAAQGNEPQPC